MGLPSVVEDIQKRLQRVLFAAEYAASGDLPSACRVAGCDESILLDERTEALVDSLVRQKMERALVTQDMVLGELYANAMISRSTGDVRGSTSALKTIGELLGMGGEKNAAPGTAIQINIGRSSADDAHTALPISVDHVDD